MLNLDIQRVLHLHLEEAKKKPKINQNYLITEKLDGWFVYVDYTDKHGWSNIHSRQQRLIPSLVKNTSFLNLPTPKHNCRLIAEAVIPGLDFHTANGILNRSKGECQAKDVEFHLHDIVFPTFPNIPNIDRYNILQELPKVEDLHIVELLGVSKDREIWMDYANKVWEKGGEGIVLKAELGEYRPGKRDSSLMKVKLEEFVIAECVSVYRTIGEKGNRNLNIRCRLKSGVEVDVRVPDHATIAKIEDDFNYILGKNVKIKCMCVLPDGKLREPRFSEIISE